MQEQIAIQALLNEKITEARLRNPSYSLRSFAKKAGISPATLSEILRGKRKISPKLFAKISEKLTLSPVEMNAVRTLFQENIPGFKKDLVSSKDRDLKHVQLSADQYNLIAEWHHYAILSLLEATGSKSDPLWIARKLGIAKLTAEVAIERLIRLGYLAKKNGKLIITTDYLSTPDEVVNLPLRRATSEDLHLAQSALQEVTIELRDFTAVTMAVNLEKMKEAKSMIRKFRRELSSLMTTGNKTEVYKMCIQLFPLSKGDVK